VNQNQIYWDLGDRVVIRSYTLDDAQALFDLIDANRDHLRPWMIWEHTTKTVDDTRTFIQSCLDEPVSIEGNGIWVDGELAGGIGLDIDTLSNSGEIGYWLAKPHEGRGIITRACERFFDVAFDELGLHRMELQAAAGNLRSRAVAARLGMYEEGVARDGIRVIDGYLDSVEYAILEDEWRERRVQT
jgi:ribosomal-protein-serine acetyltransferase